MAYQIRLTRSAEREFEALPRDVQARFAAALDEAATGPLRRRARLDVRRLEGRPGLWRLRVGRHRAVFEVQDDTLVFTRFGNRANVYGP